uniref:Ubiquitin carboxyl-terminal hydrolase n=1 Tax=Crassostrea virginica TaxID=6565 RepID=A0A8B8CNH2_CRAVI|nr:ubiquitin carboxyl-terminal hydrolase 14-like [Crassostrea virginica]
MPVFKVNVKWGKEKFSDVECNTDEPPMVFKAQMFALSGVQPDRQKIMVKGAVVKDDDWGNIKLKDGAMFMMMGSADALPQAPVEKTMFVEDMTDQQLAKALEMPPGLMNLGNTCYMNATVQCLRAIPELREALRKYGGNLSVAGGVSAADSITAALRDLYNSMDKKPGGAIPPMIFIQVLHMAYPQFAEKSEHGGFAQQDANECWTEVVRCLQQEVDVPQELLKESSRSSSRFIDQYLGGEFEVSMKCEEAEGEPESKSTEKFYQLSCFIEKDVKYMQTGLRSRLEEHITKNSPSLGRDAIYKKSSKIKRLPGYLAIQFVRFYYKEKEAINAKILKDVKFTMSLDVYDLCTPELQAKLQPARDKFKELEDKKAEEMIQNKASGKTEEEPAKPTKVEPYSFPDDLGSSNSGFYELQAVLTHKGRSSSSGHYVAWVKKKGDEWYMFDDDNVTCVTAEDVLKLSGGGDWHSAYVLLYGPRVLEVPLEETS